MTACLIAAPASGAGKTTVTLALLRLLTREGRAPRGAKSGPDYIDPRFHQAASGRSCATLDAWAMSPDRLLALAAGPGLLVVEGAMGLFDGAPPEGRGAAADLARILGIPVILVIDAGRMAHSVAALAAGFARHDPEVPVAGLILNNVGSDRHEAMLRRALAPLGLPVLAALPRAADLVMPSRHLGLVQAAERPDLDAFLDRAADWLAPRLDRAAFDRLLRPPRPPAGAARRLAPPGQRVAVAQDAAFAFVYPQMLDDWRAAGAEILPFSPLADAAVPARADAVFLPGGYPELHAGRIAGASRFLASLRAAAGTGPVHGECGGYMVLGEGLVDADGVRHRMAGLLPLETSFETRRLHLGYRRLTDLGGPFGGDLAGHEFHYATTLRAEGPRLYAARDAAGTELEPMGLRHGAVSGSFAHVIDRADAG